MSFVMQHALFIIKYLLKTLNLMKTKTTKRVCLTRGKEIFACSSQGFRNENTDTSVNMNCKKGGVTVWLS